MRVPKHCFVPKGVMDVDGAAHMCARMRVQMEVLETRERVLSGAQPSPPCEGAPQIEVQP